MTAESFPDAADTCHIRLPALWHNRGVQGQILGKLYYRLLGRFRVTGGWIFRIRIFRVRRRHNKVYLVLDSTSLQKFHNGTGAKVSVPNSFLCNNLTMKQGAKKAFYAAHDALLFFLGLYLCLGRLRVRL